MICSELTLLAAGVADTGNVGAVVFAVIFVVVGAVVVVFAGLVAVVVTAVDCAGPTATENFLDVTNPIESIACA